jgi:two-component system, OmpR family, phosphate regulon sensor histidine kinase PhoR
MKRNRTTFFILTSSLALLAVITIQFNWILKTVKYKEEFFNEKANIIQARTTEVISLDKETSKKLEIGLGEKEKKKIDSLLKHYTDYYNFHEDYVYELKKSSTHDANIGSEIQNYFDKSQKACYKKSINNLNNSNDWELKITYPNRKSSIMKEMGLPFLVSVILILIVLGLFWRTVLSLIREKKISEHTIDFLNNMTHEFKTPLTSISLAGNLIVKDATLKQDDEIKHNTEIILEENEKLRLQVEQVLSMTALERGEIPLQKTDLDFHQLIKNFLKSITLQIENKMGNLKLDLKANQVVIVGDKIHLTNAIRNLLDNAINYSIGKPELCIQTYNIDKNLVIAISDKGIGIEKEYQKKVFEKYFRVPKGNLHDVKGFGLGLAYVKKIIELHGGEIELKSDKENGTTFTVTLPNE